MLLGEFYAYTGLFSFGLTWLAVFYVLHKNPREFNKSISHHAAKNLKAYRLFAIIMSLALFSLAIYVLLFLAPTLNLHIFIVSLLVVAIVMELLTTWIPLTDDRKFHPHAVLSNSTALLMPLITAGMIVFSQLNKVALVVAYVGLVTMIGLLIVFFTIQRARKMYLIYQSIYVVAFQLTIILVPFLI